MRDRGAGICPEYWSFLAVATLARLSFPSNILLKSPPRSRLKSSSTLGGVTVVEVDAVGALGRPFAGVLTPAPIGLDGGDSSIVGGAGRCFFCPPKENVRPAAFRNPAEEDFGIGGTGMSVGSFLCAPRHSSEPPVSAVEGVVETLLCRDELSVKFVLVFEEPLPLWIISKRMPRTATPKGCLAHTGLA